MAAPHTALPAPTSKALRESSRSQRMPIQAAMAKVPVTINQKKGQVELLIKPFSDPFLPFLDDLVSGDLLEQSERKAT